MVTLLIIFISFVIASMIGGGASVSIGGILMDPGDRRCKEAITSYLEEFVTVQTKYGNVRGRYVYLCDGKSRSFWPRNTESTNPSCPMVKSFV